MRDKAFNIAKDPKYFGYQRGLALMVYKFFDKSSGGGVTRDKVRDLSYTSEMCYYKGNYGKSTICWRIMQTNH